MVLTRAANPVLAVFTVDSNAVVRVANAVSASDRAFDSVVIAAEVFVSVYVLDAVIASDFAAAAYPCAPSFVAKVLSMVLTRAANPVLAVFTVDSNAVVRVANAVIAPPWFVTDVVTDSSDVDSPVMPCCASVICALPSRCAARAQSRL